MSARSRAHVVRGRSRNLIDWIRCPARERGEVFVATLSLSSRSGLQSAIVVRYLYRALRAWSCAVVLKRALALGIVVAQVTFVSAQTPPVADDRPPVALPPFIVEEATKGPPWRYAEMDGYEILSRCSDGITRKVVEAHYQLHQLLAELLPPQLQVKMSLPRILILYDDELQPAASKEVIAQLLRNSERPPDAASMGIRGGMRAPASMQRYSFLPNLRLWDMDGMAVFMIVRRDDFNADRLALTHDYVAFMVKSRVPALPLWFVQGFLALHRDISYRDGRLKLEPLLWLSREDTDAIKTAAKEAAKEKSKTAPSPLMPLAEFLALKLGPRDPASTHTPVERWQAQAALFARWGLAANDGAHRKAFWKFTERSALEGVSEALFQECFGFDFAAASAQLVAYLPQATRRADYFAPNKMPKLPPLALRNASQGQIARIKGDWERLEVPYVRSISPDLAPKYLEQARRTLKRGYDQDERDPRLLAVLGLCETDAGNTAAAREYFEAGARVGAMRPRAQLELARLRLAEFRTQTETTEGRLTVRQTADVLRPLFEARAGLPPLPEVYETIAAAWAASGATPTRGHLAVLAEGVRLFPRRLELLLASAELNLRHGFMEEAVVFVEIAERLGEAEPVKARIAALRAKLERN